MHLIVQNQLTEIQRIALLVAQLAEKEQFQDDVVHDVNLVLEEVISNIILYGYEDAEEHLIDVELRYNEREFTLKIEDDAKAFNPLDAPEPDLDMPLEERPIGGLGIYLTRSLMDELNYMRTQGKNILTLKKKLNGRRKENYATESHDL